MMTDIADRATQWEESDARELIDLAVHEVQLEGTRADHKAAALLALFGVVVGVVLAAATAGGQAVATTVTLWVSAAPMIGAFARLLLVIRPAFPGGVPFARYALRTPLMIAEEFRREADAPMMNRADRLHRLSAAVVRKYRGTRQAVHLMMLGGAGLVTAAVLAGLT